MGELKIKNKLMVTALVATFIGSLGAIHFECDRELTPVNTVVRSKALQTDVVSLINELSRMGESSPHFQVKIAQKKSDKREIDLSFDVKFFGKKYDTVRLKVSKDDTRFDIEISCEMFEEKVKLLLNDMAMDAYFSEKHKKLVSSCQESTSLYNFWGGCLSISNREFLTKIEEISYSVDFGGEKFSWNFNLSNSFIENKKEFGKFEKKVQAFTNNLARITAISRVRLFGVVSLAALVGYNSLSGGKVTNVILDYSKQLSSKIASLFSYKK